MEFQPQVSRNTAAPHVSVSFVKFPGPGCPSSQPPFSSPGPPDDYFWCPVRSLVPAVGGGPQWGGSASSLLSANPNLTRAGLPPPGVVKQRPGRTPPPEGGDQQQGREVTRILYGAMNPAPPAPKAQVLPKAGRAFIFHGMFVWVGFRVPNLSLPHRGAS